MDKDTSVQSLKDAVNKFAAERDWLQFHSPKNLSMALSVEASELVECFLWCDSEASRDFTQGDEMLEAVSDELADIVVYALQFANVAGIDISDAIRSKMLKNGEKYPVAKSKGRAVKYNEL